MTDPKEVRGLLVMLQSVLIQEAMEHPAGTTPGFRAVTAAVTFMDEPGETDF